MMGAKVLTVVTDTVLLGDAIRESKSRLAHAAAAALRRVYSRRLHLFSSLHHHCKFTNMPPSASNPDPFT